MTEVAVIIPAYNEGERIANVIEAALDSTLATEVIVVSDGSSDNTVEVAQRYPDVVVVNLAQNLGKGGAMAAGVKSCTAPIVAFVDADLKGLESSHIDQIIKPLLENRCKMCVGVFRGGKIGSNASMAVTPFLSGQRALRRELFESLPYIGELRYGVELALTNHAKNKRAKVMRVVLKGVSNCYKEEKLGLMKGIAARTKMYKEITEAMVRTRRRRPVKPGGKPAWKPPTWPRIPR